MFRVTLHEHNRRVLRQRRAESMDLRHRGGQTTPTTSRIQHRDASYPASLAPLAFPNTTEYELGHCLGHLALTCSVTNHQMQSVLISQGRESSGFKSTWIDCKPSSHTQLIKPRLHNAMGIALLTR